MVADALRSVVLFEPRLQGGHAVLEGRLPEGVGDIPASPLDDSSQLVGPTPQSAGHAFGEINCP